MPVESFSSITGLPVTVEPGKGSSRSLTFMIMSIQHLIFISNHKMVLSELVVCLISLVDPFAMLNLSFSCF